MSQLRIPIKHAVRKMQKAEGYGNGPQGRMNRLRQLVTSLVRDERIEGSHEYMSETRGYAERLISEAARNGDKNKETMKLADFWLLEKDLIHKLFKVLGPRYENHSTCYTSIFKLGPTFPGRPIPISVLELKGNPWLPVDNKPRDKRNSLVNILIKEAKNDYNKEKKLLNSNDK